jgi:hypothetical protein
MAKRFPKFTRLPPNRKQSLAAARSLATLKAALRHFRPRKSEYGSWVWITSKPSRGKSAGQRMGSNDRRKGFAVYVAKSKHVKHRVRVYQEPVIKTVVRGGQAVKIHRGRKPATPRAQGTVDLTQSGPKYQKKAAEKFYAQLPKAKIRFESNLSFRAKGYDFNKQVARDVAQKLQRAANFFQSKRTFIIKTICVVQGLDKNLKGKVFNTQEFSSIFQQADRQKYESLGFYTPWVTQKLYAQLAEQLRGQFHFVSEGSKRAVAALPWNQGKGEKQWKDRRGHKWDKIGLPTVRIVAWQSKIEYHQIRSKPSGKKYTGGDVAQPF